MRDGPTRGIPFPSAGRATMEDVCSTSLGSLTLMTGVVRASCLEDLPIASESTSGAPNLIFGITDFSSSFSLAFALPFLVIEVWLGGGGEVETMGFEEMDNLSLMGAMRDDGVEGMMNKLRRRARGSTAGGERRVRRMDSRWTTSTWDSVDKQSEKESNCIYNRSAKNILEQHDVATWDFNHHSNYRYIIYIYIYIALAALAYAISHKYYS